MAEVNVTPELRFPEFKDKWTILKLSEVTVKIQDGTHFSPPINDKKDYKYITSKNIRNGYLDLKDIDYVSANEHLKIYKRADVKKGDVLLTKDGASTGNACINNLSEEFSLLSSVAFIRADDLASTNEFVFQLLSSSRGQKEIFKSIAGQAITRITLNKLRNYKFAFPSIQEQQKIASFLTAVDKRIQGLQQKKAKLEEYKKGLMQQLFSQQIRFKDENGNDFPDWEEKKLGEVGEIITGKTPTTSDKELWNGDIDFITPTDIIDEIKYQKIVARTVCETEKMRILPIGAIVYTCIASIGKMAITTKPSITNQQINALIVNEEHLNEFVYYSLLKQTPKIKSTQANTTLPIINKTEFSKIKIALPSLPEQKKIANFLTSLDESIESVEKHIAATTTFKKGLLQKMFV